MAEADRRPAHHRRLVVIRRAVVAAHQQQVHCAGLIERRGGGHAVIQHRRGLAAAHARAEDDRCSARGQYVQVLVDQPAGGYGDGRARDQERQQRASER